MINWLKEFLHNVLVHPSLMFMSSDLGTRFHDWNSNWSFALNRY